VSMILLGQGSYVVRVVTMLKKFAIAVTLISVFVVQFNASNDAAALPPTGDWAICVGMNWSETDCGYYELFEADGSSTGLAIGGPNEADGWWDCASLGRNGCRALKIRGISPTYVIDTSTSTSTTTVTDGSSSTSTTTVTDGSSSTSTTTVTDGSSSTSTTTIAQPVSLAHCPTAVCGYAVVDDQNYVYGVIVCSDACTGTRMTDSYMGCPAGCRLILQAQQTSDGNVAGWHGQDVKYDESSGSYTLPGGGTLKSGDKLEDAIFPKVVTVVDIVSPEVVETIAAPSGKLYENTNDYANAETETVVTSSMISVELPTFQVHELDYQVSFDPNGAEPEFLIASGKIVNDSISSDVVKQSVGSLSFSVNAAKNSSKIVLRLEQLRGKNGLLKLSLRKAAMNFAEIGVKINSPKKYSSCRALVKDYPGGVITSAKWTDKKTKKQKFDYYAKPTLNNKVFVLNQKLDFDKDKIICEKNN
jgi:hypothetical protein